jgi:hypothetical protein
LQWFSIADSRLPIAENSLEIERLSRFTIAGLRSYSPLTIDHSPKEHAHSPDFYPFTKTRTH